MDKLNGVKNGSSSEENKTEKVPESSDKEAISSSRPNSWIIPAKQIFEAHSSKYEAVSESPTDPRLAQVGVLYCPNRVQYIKKKSPNKKKINQLNYSARVTFVSMEIKLHHEGCLMTVDNNFVALVKLEHPELLDDCRGFERAREVLLEQLKIIKVFRDEMKENRDSLREQLIPAIESVIQKSAFNEKHANNYLHLVKITNMLKNSDRINYRNLCREISNNKIVSEELKTFSKELFRLEESVIKRDKWFAMFGIPADKDQTDLIENMTKLLDKTINMFRNNLKEGAPDYLQNFVQSTNENRISLISSEDIKLFKDISSILNKNIFQKPLEDLIERWIDMVNDIKINETSEVVRFTQSIFFFLCKSLEEVIIQISHTSGIEMAKLLTSDINGWYPIRAISWKQVHPLNSCLEFEYNFIFKLLKHFDITHRAVSPFTYNVALLNRSKSSTYRQLMESAKNMIKFNKSKNHLGVSDEIFVWYCMLDDVLSNVLPFASTKQGGEFDLFGNILQNYTKLVREAGHDQLETVRAISHSLGRFIVQAIHLLKQDHGSSVTIERRVLHGQLDVVGRVGFESSDCFRDLIDVFSDYWTVSNEIIAVLPSKINLPEMKEICTKLLEIVLTALKKTAGATEMINFCRVYNDFIIDLGEVQLDWFVKTENVKEDSSKIRIIENKWNDSNKATYRITKIDDFLKLFDSLPKHYTINVINTLLSNVQIQLSKSEWSPNNKISEIDQITTSTSLISAIRSSLIYLAEQPEYVSFDRFYEERVNPFISVVTNSANRSDFYRRVNLIKESFWHIRKQNEMNIDDALELIEELNENIDCALLRKAHYLYCKHFDEMMEISSGKEQEERVKFVVQQVKTSVQQIHYKLWTQQFKQRMLPIILAKLAALWAIQVSKDVSSHGGYFKPHCIQVLCILRLLSADKLEEGVGKHFAQVLTGQGKSLVLALTAAILVLTGHKVDVICYNEYLMVRDATDFVYFFYALEIIDDIQYQTFETMADNMITLKSNGEHVGLRELVRNLILNETQPSLSVFDKNIDKSVLLIDEVDVFFTKEFYGSKYMPACPVMVPGLSTIQEHVWKIINENIYWDDMLSSIQEFRDSDLLNIEEFQSFLNEVSYDLLDGTDGRFERRRYTNTTLFDEHLQRMALCGWNIHKNKLENSDISIFKLSDTETIHCMDETGKYSNNFCSYYNIFSYFKLKKSNFVTEIDGEKNYGYFQILCGAISYALLPLKYPLILGVTGTLTNLNDHEKDAIENLYNIKQLSIMPSFFGSTNLRFDEKENFHSFWAAEEWMNKIFQSTYTEIAKNRAVIIFFESEHKWEEFRKKYFAKFDRINILSANTEMFDRDRLINEAGIAKTVTLATRQMGRGVDFKSSVVVEKNGGVHVIQTFFSLDVKEEIQIKGRTARKDNKGSYELIVCRKDLSEITQYGHLDFTYADLDSARKYESVETHKKISEQIKVAQKDHELTMEYLQSFCKEKLAE